MMRKVLPGTFVPVFVVENIGVMFTIVILVTTCFAQVYKNVRVAAIFSRNLISGRIFRSKTSVSSRRFPGRDLTKQMQPVIPNWPVTPIASNSAVK